MAESSICRAEVSKNGKVNPSTTWTVFIRGVEHQVVLSRKWSQKVVVLYDGGVILDKRFVSKPPEGCFAAWAGDGVSFAVYYNSAIANRYELQVNGVEFSQLPLSAVVRAHRERQQRKRAEENARRQPKTYVLRAVRSTPSGKQLSAESCSSSSSGSGRNLRC
ncbi:unnamed protein product [Sphacelaria rigidula]